MLCFRRPNFRNYSWKFFVSAAAMSLVVSGLLALIFYVSGVRNNHDDLQYSMAEPIKQDNGKIYFPFGQFLNYNSSTSSLKCQKGYYACNASNTCLELSRRCDGIVDCAAAEDELNCVCAFRLSMAKFCDKYPDCFDESDENYCNYCPPHSFNCGNGKCIPRNKVCDSYLDCDNAMDENFCFRLSPAIPVAPVDETEGSVRSVALKSGFLLRNQQGVWYPVCASRYDVMLDNLASHACVSITANPLASSTHQLRHFENFSESSSSFIHHIYGRFIHWSGCLTDEGIFVTCDDVLCGFNPKLLLPRAPQGRIVGGELSDPGAWPWHAAVYKNGTYSCGATLISNYWLISASHCFLNHKSNYYEVQLGMLRRRSFTPHQKTYRLERIVSHHKFNIVTLDFDIAMIKTAEPITFDFWVRPICLPDPRKLESSGSFCTAIGWGDTSEKADDSDDLQEVHIPLTATCRNSERWICAGYPEGGRDACQGDSGGPLMCLQDDGLSWYIAGVISAGTGCARPKTPGMYTRVAYFINWIREAINSNGSPNDYPLTSCPGWTCAAVGGGHCLPPEKICDSHVDCYDAQDEVNCYQGKKYRPPGVI